MLHNTTRWVVPRHFRGLASKATRKTNSPIDIRLLQEKLDFLRGLSQDVNKEINFQNTQVAYASKSSWDLTRALAVFQLCQVRPLVEHADGLIKLSNSVFGKSITNSVIQHSFFAHFCAGTDEESIRPNIQNIRNLGVGGILDYAAEADLSHVQKDTSKTQDIMQETRDQISARTYDYVSEQQCDANMKLFERCIESVYNVTPEGFAAVKVTALGNPILLQRVSQCMKEIQTFFSKLDVSKDGFIDLDDFKIAYRENFKNTSDEEIESIFAEVAMKTTLVKSADVDMVEFETEVSKELAHVDEYKTKQLDYIEWTKVISPQEIAKMVKGCKVKGPLYQSSLSDEELELYENMIHRIDTVCKLARDLKVRVLIDAEQTYFQEAIDSIALHMQRKYNTKKPIVFNTYQCYLKNATEKVDLDMERAKREGWIFCGKMVRGAYMVQERARALEFGYESPIHDSLDDTHACYDEAVAKIIKHPRSNVLVATHNLDSCKKAIQIMKEHNIDPTFGGVYFGQLLGMADHITFTLGAHKYNAYKYIPYGPVDEVIPYLVRRAHENSDVLTSVTHEQRALKSELKRRALSYVGIA